VSAWDARTSSIGTAGALPAARRRQVVTPVRQFRGDRAALAVTDQHELVDLVPGGEVVEHRVDVVDERAEGEVGRRRRVVVVGAAVERSAAALVEGQHRVAGVAEPVASSS
jgi:hypothetical protein